MGKYGLLVQEYLGINDMVVQEPTRTLAEQSRVVVDAVESESKFLWPHIPHFYRKVHVGRVEEIYQTIGHYEVVLMIDVIEHIDKSKARAMVEHFVSWDSTVL